MTLTEMRTALQTELADSDWDTDELDRAVTEAVADVSRFLPDEKSKEFTLTFEVSEESFTSEDAHGTYVSLVHKPIDYDSETVTSADGNTTYTRDTDYTMEYREGKITTISGGSMELSTEYLISYTVDKASLDISLITDAIRIVRVEYPVGNLPQSFVDFGIWNNILYINIYSDGQSQNMFEGKHIIVYYQAECTAPTVSADGSYPSVLDEIILKGATAYALMIRGIKEQHDARTDLDSAATDMGSVSITDIETALDKVITYVGNADTALSAVSTRITEALTALDKVATEIEQAGSDTGEDMEGISDILTDVDSALDEVSTQISSMGTALGEIAAIWTDEETYRDYSNTLLTSGDDYINKVNVGDRVAEMYNLFANTQANLARLSESVRNTKLAEAETYLTSASYYVAEANARFGLINSRIEMSRERVNQARGYMEEADRRINAAGGYLNQANTNLSSDNTYIAEANSRIAAQELLKNSSDGYINLANQHQSVSSRYLQEAIERRNEFWSILRDKAQYRNELSVISQRQPA